MDPAHSEEMTPNDRSYRDGGRQAFGPHRGRDYQAKGTFVSNWTRPTVASMGYAKATNAPSADRVFFAAPPSARPAPTPRDLRAETGDPPRLVRQSVTMVPSLFTAPRQRRARGNRPTRAPGHGQAHPNRDGLGRTSLPALERADRSDRGGPANWEGLDPALERRTGFEPEPNRV